MMNLAADRKSLECLLGITHVLVGDKEGALLSLKGCSHRKSAS